MSKLVSIGSIETTTSDVVEVYDEVVDKWTRLPDIDVPRRSYMVEVVNGKIMLVGGSLISHVHNQPESTVQALDPATGTLTEVAPLQVARLFSGSAVVGEGNDSLLYICGGWGDTSALDSVERWNPVTNTWTFVKNLPKTNVGCRAVSVNGVLYVVGGRYNTDYIDDVIVYNPTSDTWENKSPMLNTNGYFGIAAHNNYIYVVAGYRTTHNALNAVERYDVTTDTWTLLASITEVGEVGLTVFNDKVVVAGGNHVGLETPHRVEEYNEETNTWRRLASLNVGRTASHLITIPASIANVKFNWKSITPY